MNLMPEEFASEMVSPVYLLTTHGSLGLRQPHPAQEVGVTRIRSHPVPQYVRPEIDHATRALSIALFEQPERLVFVAETCINPSNHIKIDIGVRGQVLKFLSDLQSISPPARHRVNPTKSTSDEL